MKSAEAIDRITPTLEPDTPVLMRQNWHHLLFLHWEITPEVLQRMLPPELTVDTHDGKAYVGVVPFTMTGVRPVLTPPLPWISNFHEVNVRTYVHRDGRDPGVWFFSLDASSTIAVAAARAMYKLPYFHSQIDFFQTKDPTPLIDFRAQRDDSRGALPANGHFQYAPMDGIKSPAAPGSLEFFLVERYILYTTDEQKNLRRARVHHQPYPLQRAELLECDETLVWACGIQRGEARPLRYYAEEVNVSVYQLEKC
jgi:uncharacterized protein YqjF (DUF2071 family)